MPQVGGKHFPYTEAGYKAADAAKKRMGHKDYRKGGLFYKTGGLTDAEFQKKMDAYKRRVAEGKKYGLKGVQLSQYTGPRPTK
jgi:hypothetical protein